MTPSACIQFGRGSTPNFSRGRFSGITEREGQPTQCPPFGTFGVELFYPQPRNVRFTVLATGLSTEPGFASPGIPWQFLRHQPIFCAPESEPVQEPLQRVDKACSFVIATGCCGGVAKRPVPCAAGAVPSSHGSDSVISKPVICAPVQGAKQQGSVAALQSGSHHGRRMPAGRIWFCYCPSGGY